MLHSPTVSFVITELQYDKTNKWPVRPLKTQISLDICQVWSESSLSAILIVHSKGSDQTGWMTRLVWVFAGCTRHFVDYRLISDSILWTKHSLQLNGDIFCSSLISLASLSRFLAVSLTSLRRQHRNRHNDKCVSTSKTESTWILTSCLLSP